MSAKPLPSGTSFEGDPFGTIPEDSVSLASGDASEGDLIMEDCSQEVPS